MSDINKARAKLAADRLDAPGLDTELECMQTGRKTTIRQEIETRLRRSLAAEQGHRTRRRRQHAQTRDMFDDDEGGIDG